MKKGVLKRIASLITAFIMVISIVCVTQPMKANAATELSTTIKFYKDMSGTLAYTIVSNDVKTSFSGQSFKGTITINETSQDVNWTVSGNCFVISNIINADVDTIKITAGTKLVNEATGNTITLTNGFVNRKPSNYGTDGYVGTEWTTENEEIAAKKVTFYAELASNFSTVMTSSKQIVYNVSNTEGAFVVSEYLLGGAARGWYDCNVEINGEIATIQAFLGEDNSSNSNLSTIRFGQTVLATAIDNGSVIKIPKQIVLTKTGYEITLNLGNEQTIALVEGNWTAEATKDRETFGLTFSSVNTEEGRILYSITDNKDAFVDDYANALNMRGWYTTTVKVGEEDVEVEIFLGDGTCIFGNKDDAISAAINAGTSITIPETLVATTMNATTANYVITLNVGEEQSLGMTDSGYGVLPTELVSEIRFYKDINGTLAYTILNEEVKSEFEGQTFVGTIIINGVEQDVNWAVSGNCLVINGIINADVERIQVVAETKLVNEAGDSITITNELVNDRPDNYGAEDYDPTNWPKKPDPHVHVGVKAEAVKATCTEKGNIAYWTCECGSIFGDEDCEVEIAAEDIVIAAGHKEVVVKGKAATATATGLTDGKQCSVCGKWSVEQKVIEKKKVTVSKTTISKLTAKKKAVTVKWKKKSGVNGYEIQISLKKNFKKIAKSATIQGVGKKSKTIKGLKSKKKYYVRIRTYKYVDGGKFTSDWAVYKKNVKVK